VPAGPQMIEHAVAQTRIGRLVHGADATGRAMGQVVNTLLALQDLLLCGGDRIQSVDLNPLLLTSQGCIAVDALVVTRPA
jgi:acetate---CoA ligase (ADP-forming)